MGLYQWPELGDNHHGHLSIISQVISINQSNEILATGATLDVDSLLVIGFMRKRGYFLAFFFPLLSLKKAFVYM